MAKQRPDIVYVHQGTPRTYEQVNAIRQAGYSCRLLAGYYYRENGLFERLVRRIAPRTTATLKRRHLEKLPEGVVERSFVQDFLMAIEQKFRWLLPNFLITRARYIDLRASIRVRMLKPRVVIVCDSHALRTLRAAKKVGAVAVLDQLIGHVTAGNEILSEEQKRHPEIGANFRPTPRRMVRRCIREVAEADYIFVPSDYVRASLLPLGVREDRIFLIPYGVDTRMFTPSENKETTPFKILFAGHVGLRKGVYYLLEALKAAELPDAQAILLGNVDGNGKWLEEYNGLYTRIGHTPHQEIPAIFAGAHVYAYPSLHEGSTVSIYEAMAAGLPVVATPNAGSVVRDGKDGFIVPVRDIESLRAAIERLYHDPDLRNAMGRSAAARVEDFSWDAYSRRIGEALKMMLEDR